MQQVQRLLGGRLTGKDVRLQNAEPPSPKHTGVPVLLRCSVHIQQGARIIALPDLQYDLSSRFLGTCESLFPSTTERHKLAENK